MRVSAEGAAVRAPSQAWEHVFELARTKLLPVVAIFGDNTVTSDFGEHHAQGKDVGRLVESTRELLRSKVVTVTFAINTSRSWPLACQAKVGNLQPTLKVNENIGGLEIKVNVSCFVNGFETLQWGLA